MPSHAGYEPIAGNDESDLARVSLDSQDGLVRSRGRVDLKGIDTAFKRWTEAVAQKVKINRRKKLEGQPEKREVAFSVFQQTYGKLPPLPVRHGWWARGSFLADFMLLVPISQRRWIIKSLSLMRSSMRECCGVCVFG